MLEEPSNVWSRTVALLDSASARQVTIQAPKIAQTHTAQTNWEDHTNLMVHVIDRPSPRTITVSWRDPLSGYYGYQVWRASIAKRAGKCVLNGNAIKTGDAIYRPSVSQPPPGNVDAMIVASCIDGARAGKQS
jgi:uncharacterized protein DUF3331